MVSGFQYRADKKNPPEKGDGVKDARKKQRVRLDQEERELMAKAGQLDRKHGDWPRPRPRKKLGRSEADLLTLGGVKEMVRRKDGSKSRIIFGGKGETRLIFTPWHGAWRVQSDPEPSLEELKRELNRSGRNLWNAALKKPDIAVQAVDALRSCSRDWQDFAALPKRKQKRVDVYRAMIRTQLAILTTLEVLKRDVELGGRKLQLAFELLTEQGWPGKIGKLRHHAVTLAGELGCPPSKKELKDRFDSPLPHHPVRPSEFSALLKVAGLSWLKRGK
jgi:hypothetical protein